MLSKIDLICRERVEKAIAQGRDKFFNHYDYSEVCFNTRWDKKVKIRCLKHNFVLERTFSSHLNSSFGGCRLCFRELNCKAFLEQCAKIHGNKYDYSRVIYTKSENEVEIICHIHGSFFQTPTNHLNHKGCQKCSFNERVRNQYDNKEAFIKKAKAFHGEKYDYSLVEYVGAKQKVKIICKVHGVFEQIPSGHYHSGCKFCRNEKTGFSQRKTTKAFIEICQRIHGNRYDYSDTEYISMLKPVKIKCRIHGFFQQIAGNHQIGAGCQKCSITKSSLEETLETFLRKSGLSFEVRKRNLIPPKEIDIYVNSAKIAIECNGLLWHSEFPYAGKGKDFFYHLDKINKCNEKGINLFHFIENDIRFKSKVVESTLNRYLGINKSRLSFEKCEVKQISKETKSKFLSKYEINGNRKSNFNLGIFYKNRLVSVAAFIKNKSSRTIKLVRLSEMFGFCVENTLLELEKILKSTYSCNKIQIKLNNNWPRSDIQTDCFKKLKILPPKCHYHNNKLNSNTKFLSEGQFISKLTKLGKYDKLLTVAENCVNNKWNRIWDTGSTIYEKDL